MSKLKKVLLMCTAYVLVAALAIGGTIAYLQDSDSDVNVMTLGNVSIVQNEQDRDGNDFVQGQTLLPYVTLGATEKETVEVNGYEIKMRTKESVGNYMDKIVTVTNTGKTDAYVRTLIAIPAALENEDASKNIIHWNAVSDTDTDPNNGWMWDIDNDKEWGAPVYATIEVEGVKYNVYVATNKNVIKAGESTAPSLVGIYLDSKVDSDGDKYTYDGQPIDYDFSNGVKVLVLSQAVQAAGFADADTALDTAFGEITSENHPWMKDSVAVPEDAVKASDFDSLKAALANGGDVVVTEDVALTASIDISKDTVLYAENGAELSFAPAAQMKVKDGATLELKGVKVDNGDTFGFGADGKLDIDDLDGRKTNAAFDVAAGSTIIIGEGTEISNIVSKGNAVVSASGTADNRATVILKGAVADCAGKSGAIINANANADVYIEDGTVIKGNVSYDNNNHGIIRVYSGSVVYINGGEITDNIYSGNGLIGIYHASVVVNGGMIYGNSYCVKENTWVDSTSASNGRYGLVYIHNNSLFTMNGGAIFGNVVGSDWGAIDSVRASGSRVPSVIINGGQIRNNTYEGVDSFGSTDSVNHIELSDAADVSGLIYNYSDNTLADVNTYKK